ncbi:ATP-grasp domain-containing protein [Streptomyces sp. NPDC056480]|uniref:ATP-grasp domain-containing protein n=1 Tax=Streptomyces sp. NPDC056480 TaxID=3345833 RepID=UPI0036B4B0D1
MCRLDPEHLARLSDITDHTAVIALRTDAPDSEWTALAAAVHAHSPFTRIVTFTETDQDRCAAIGAALSVPAHSPSTVRMVHDKQAMRARLRETGVDDTPSVFVADLEEARTFVRVHGLPCIVKPVSGAGSVGIALVTAESEIEQAVQRATATGQAIIEPFHVGPQFSVEALSENGDHYVVAVTRKFSDPHTLVELGHIVPADLTGDELNSIRDYVPRLLAALNVTSGPTHTELVLTPKGPRVIETHLRMGGDEIPQLIHDATGIDLPGYVARQSAGMNVLDHLRTQAAQTTPARHAAIWFASPPASGLLTSIDGMDEAGQTQAVTSVQLLIDPGTRIGSLDSSTSRLAFARAIAPTGRQAVEAARQAIARLTFGIRMQARDEETI